MSYLNLSTKSLYTTYDKNMCRESKNIFPTKVIKMIDVKYAYQISNMIDEFHHSRDFTKISKEAEKTKAFVKPIENHTDWRQYLEKATAPFRYYDIVDIAKTVRKEFKKEFGKNMKISIRTERNWECDTLSIVIKDISPDYLIPLDEYEDECKKENLKYDGVEHTCINDEVFEKHCKTSIYRIKEPIMVKIAKLANLFVMDNSDMMTDYFDRNYIAQLKMEIDGESHGGYHII